MCYICTFSMNLTLLQNIHLIFKAIKKLYAHIVCLRKSKSMGILLGLWITPSWGPGNLTNTPHPSAITAHKTTEDLCMSRARVPTGAETLEFLQEGLEQSGLGRELPVIPKEAVPCPGTAPRVCLEGSLAA